MDKPRSLPMAAIISYAVAAFFIAGAAVGVHRALFSASPEFDRLLEGVSVHINAVYIPEAGIAYFAERALLYCFGLAVIWFLAFFPSSAALTLVYVFGKGCALGFTATILWTLYAGEGLLYAAVLILPQNLLIVPACIGLTFRSLCHAVGTIRARAVMRKSGASASSRAGRVKISIHGASAKYPAYLAAALLCGLAAAAFETWVTPMLWKML